MGRSVVLAKMLAGAVEASFHRGDAGFESFGDFGVAAALLDEGEQGPVLGPELGQGMAQRIEFLGVDRAGRFGNVFVLLAERQENAAEFLAPQLVDARVARETEKPRFELRRRLEPVERPDHLDEDLLAEVLDVIAAAGHGEDEPGHPVLVRHDELPLGRLVAPLGAADQFDKIGRSGIIHAGSIGVWGKTREWPERFGRARPTLAFGATFASARRPNVPPMSHPAPSPAALRCTLLAAALALAGCGSNNGPRDLMMEEAVASQPLERPVAMRGEATFLEGKLGALATVSRGFDRGARGPGRTKGGEAMEMGGRRKKDDAGAFSEVYNIGGYGDSEEEQKEAMAEYMRIAKARRAAGSPMPPVTLRVQLENRGTEPLEVEVTEVNSYLGNFAVRPPKLTIAPGAKAVLDPMVSQLGVSSDEIQLKLEVRQGGKKESQVVIVKNIIADSLRKEFERTSK